MIQYTDKAIGDLFTFGDANEIKNSVNSIYQITGFVVGDNGNLRPAVSSDFVDVEWDNILSKPSSFAPSSHTQDIDTITGLQAILDGLAGQTTTNASLLTSGTLDDARLSVNVAMRNAPNAFIGNQTVTGSVTTSGLVQTQAGDLTTSGLGLGQANIGFYRTAGFDVGVNRGGINVATFGDGLATFNGVLGVTDLALDTTGARVAYISASYLSLRTNGASRWNIDYSGHFTPHAGSTYDVGSVASPVRNIYTGAITASGAIVANGGIVLPNNGSIIGSGAASFAIGDSNDSIVFGAANNYWTGNIIARGPISNDSGDLALTGPVAVTGAITASTTVTCGSATQKVILGHADYTCSNYIAGRSMFRHYGTGTVNVTIEGETGNVSAAGNLLMGGTTSANVSASGIGLRNNNFLCSSNVANNDSYKLIGMSASDQIVIDLSGIGVSFGGAITASGTGTFDKMVVQNAVNTTNVFTVKNVANVELIKVDATNRITSLAGDGFACRVADGGTYLYDGGFFAWGNGSTASSGTSTTRLSRQSDGVVQIGTTSSNALGSLACASATFTGYFGGGGASVELQAGLSWLNTSGNCYLQGTTYFRHTSTGTVTANVNGGTGDAAFAAITASSDIIISGTSVGFRLNPGGVSRGLIYYASSENRLNSTSAHPWVVESDAGFKVRNAANTAGSPFACGRFEQSSGTFYNDTTVAMSVNGVSETYLFNMYQSGGHRMSLSATGGYLSIGPNVVTVGQAMMLKVQSRATTDIGLVVKGVTLQTAKAQEWRDSADAVNASMTVGGSLSCSEVLATQIRATNYIFYNNSTTWYTNIDGKIRLSNYAGTAGIWFDVTTNNTLAIKNLANNADGNLAVGAVTASSVAAPIITVGAGYIAWSSGTNLIANGNGGILIRNGGNATLISTDSTGAIIASGAITSVFSSSTTDLSTLDLSSGQSRLHKNTTSGDLKLFANDAGVIKSVTLT